MKDFSYVITDENGIHARPAGMLVKKASKFESDIDIAVIKSDNAKKEIEKNVNCKRLFAVMSLGAKKGDTIVFKIRGEDEKEAIKTIEEFVKENF